MSGLGSVVWSEKRAIEDEEKSVRERLIKPMNSNDRLSPQFGTLSFIANLDIIKISALTEKGMFFFLWISRFF